MEDDSSANVVKRKRTKRRQRLQRPPPAAAVSSTSSAEFSGSNTTEEEEDMANCLILLAQGHGSHHSDITPKPETDVMEVTIAGVGNTASGKFKSRRFAEAATTTSGKAGFYVYECKTCNKCFPSFQALGGHRASHKKPRLSIPSATPVDKMKMEEVSIQLSMNSSFPLQATAAGGSGSTSKARVHECSICGAEFASGQALGGHMRRHRPVSLQEPPPSPLPPPQPLPPLPPQQEVKKAGSGLALDLNLPAPTEDDNPNDAGGDLSMASSASETVTPAFSFDSKAPLLLPASPLVDCHF